MSDTAKCAICGEPMPPGEEMFKYHGYSGNCPKPPLPMTPAKQKVSGLIWAVVGKTECEVKMRFDTPEQANAFVAGLEADEAPNAGLDANALNDAGWAFIDAWNLHTDQTISWHAERRKREELEDAIRDIFPAAHRLALELECLLLDTKDTAAVSKWWDSANEALEQWREFCREEMHNAKVTGAAPTGDSKSDER